MFPNKVTLVIEPDGDRLITTYTEEINLNEVGHVRSIKRASQVEPGSDNLWYADMAPLGGPKIGPFERRSDALAMELAWLAAWMSGENANHIGVIAVTNHEDGSTTVCTPDSPPVVIPAGAR